MGPNEMTSKTNLVMRQILKRYVNAESVGADNVGGLTGESREPSAAGSSETDWYNMTCPRCPWFVDGERTRRAYDYTVVKDLMTGNGGDTAGNDGDTAGNGDDMAGNDDDAPDNALVAGNDADGDSGRTTDDDTPNDDTPNDAAISSSGTNGNAKTIVNSDLIGRKEPDCPIVLSENLNIGGGSYSKPGDVRRVPIVRCERPESVECPGDSLCVRLMVAGDLIRQQAAIDEMARDVMTRDLQEFIASSDSIDGKDKKLTKRARRSAKLQRASRKRGR